MSALVSQPDTDREKADLRQPFGPYSVVGSVQDMTSTWPIDSGFCFFSSIGSGFPGKLTDQDHFVFCGGFDVRRDMAETKAFAEAVERYLGRDLPGDQCTVSSAKDLSQPHVSISSIATCSTTEYANPTCPLRPVDEDSPLTWILGTDLLTGEPTYIPRDMVTYRGHGESGRDAFWFRISTGHAVHATRADALFGAVSEVIERDMIAITWLQRLSLPRIRVDSLAGDVRRLIQSVEDQFFVVDVYDLRNEYAVPSVYLLLSAPHDPEVRTVVGAGTGLTFDIAVRKALDEAFAGYNMLHQKSPKEDALGFGASVCGTPENDHVFDFLRQGTVEIDAPAAPFATDAQTAVDRVLVTARQRGHSVFAQCRDTEWSRALGLHAYVVVVPELMPFTPHRHAQYRAHQRLYDAPTMLGHESHTEEELNPWPQPFA